jgi:hypothetical protein
MTGHFPGSWRWLHLDGGLSVRLCTEPFGLPGYGRPMPLLSLKLVLATICVSAALVAVLTGNIDSLSSWAVLLGVGLLPPLVLIWRWNDPGQTLSESIQEARR